LRREAYRNEKYNWESKNINFGQKIRVNKLSDLSSDLNLSKEENNSNVFACWDQH
jgi:hypothetical protein